MKIDSVKMAYFSPTGTTKAVLKGIALGINSSVMELIDVTTPQARQKLLKTTAHDLLIVGVPVYMGRVPALLNEWLNTIDAHNTPTVCVVVYGNRAYENALLELKDIVTECGCVPVAGAAYIGEHSFSDSETPIALGRPNEKDLMHARKFGEKIREKLQFVPSISQVSLLDVPGTYPYEGITELWDVDFIDVGDSCSQCGICAEVCPMGAVNSQDSSIINHKKCITCCACIKSCPQNARIMKSGPVKDAQTRLNTLYKEPKQPEYYL